MTTQTQANDDRPVRNGARPAAYNYALAALVFPVKFAGPFMAKVGLMVGMAVCVAIMVVPTVMFYTFALAAELIFAVLSVASWCWMSCMQAHAITTTRVGERIPAQHGLGCLLRIWLRLSPTVNLTLWIFCIPKPSLMESECSAGCCAFRGCWRNW